MDYTKSEDGGSTTTTSPGAAAEERAGYCQECGRVLTLDTLRRVNHGVFCDLCSTTRPSTGGWQAVPKAAYPGDPARGAIPSSGEPNPVLAGVLGLIPGVGAMFNGQYAKGAMHLIVFVILVALADNLNWVLWWLVWGWIFYQAFDAYHTARARRDRLPLPNPFGWNDIGERMGFARPAQPGPTPFGSSDPYAGGAAATWVGYARPKEPVSPAYPTSTEPANQSFYAPFAEPANQNPYTAPFTPPTPSPIPPNAPPPVSVPYAPTFTGRAPGQPVATPTLIVGARRFPVGALWLIALGVLFLLGNLLPEFRLSGRWFVPLLLAALSFWSAFRRWELAYSAASLSGAAPNLAGVMIGPVVLFTVSVLLGFQVGHVLSLRRSWPVLLVIWGMMLLMQRTAATLAPPVRANLAEPPIAPPVRSTSGTGSLGL